MENDEVVAAIQAIPTPKLETLLRVVLKYSSPLMDELGKTLTLELASRNGYHHEVRFTLPPGLPAWRYRAGASEALSVSEYCDREMAGLFTVLAKVLVERAEFEEQNAPPELVN
jgi:hypothetical protein